MKYIVSYNTKFGAVSAESRNPEDLIEAFVHVKAIAGRLGSRPHLIPKSATLTTKVARRTGTGETATILRELETRLLKSDFFASPRSTGETRDRLLKTTRHTFTSRKVSQALGILWQKHLLKRAGRRNYYVYSK